MLRTKRKTSIIILAVVTFLCVVFGFFFAQKQDPMKASADTVTSSSTSTRATSYVGFYMEEGMALMRTPNKPYIGLTVHITKEMKYSLSRETQVKKVFGKTVYKPTEWYLRISQYDSNNNLVRRELFHTDPEHAELESRAIRFSTWAGAPCAKLEYPITGDYEETYTYKCEYVVYTDDYETVWTYIDQTNFFGIFDEVAKLLGLKKKVDVTAAGAATYTSRSVEHVAKMAIENEDDLTVEELNWLSYLAGRVLPSGETYTVNLKYKEVIDWGNIQEVVEQYQVSSYIAFSSEMVYGEVMNIRGSSNITAFNAIYKDPYNGDGIIYLQADGYKYIFDDATQTGTLTIQYRDFDYSNFSIRLQDNDWTNESSLFVYIRTPDVSYDEATNILSLTFWYDNIVEHLGAGLNWVFELKQENFTISNPSADIYIAAGVDYIKVSFPYDKYYENQLAGVCITAIAEIIPDYESRVTYKYISLDIIDGRILYGYEYRDMPIMYSKYVQLCNWGKFQESSNYSSLVLKALEPAGEVGTIYCQPIGVHGTRINDGEFILEIEYKHNVLFEFTDNSGDISYVAATKNSLFYNLQDLPNIAANEGERIASLKTNSTFATVNFDESASNDLMITLNIQASSFTIIPFTVEYSDTWHLNIEYFETYKDTPFALKKTYSKDISLKKYDVNNLTLKDIKSIMGITGNMEVCGLVVPDNKVATEYTSDSTYTAKVSYGMLSLSSIDYDGNKMEIRVPLTSYVDWCNQFGDDLTILFLNRTDKKYFDYSNEVAREDLYGFFTVAVFEEQVSDLNYYFKNNTGTGHVICFDQRTVSGSSAYNFFDRLRDKGPMLSAAGHVGMAFCEIVNDDNKVLQSNFIYLDNTEAYISNGGADDKDDTDDAFDNTVEDIVDKIEEKTETPLKVLRIAVAAVVGLAAVGGLTWCGFWLVARIKETSGGNKKKKKTKTRK